jgi:hypothetical protein
MLDVRCGWAGLVSGLQPGLYSSLAVPNHITVKRSVIRNSITEFAARRRKKIYVQFCDGQEEGKRRQISGN